MYKSYPNRLKSSDDALRLYLFADYKFLTVKYYQADQRRRRRLQKFMRRQLRLARRKGGER